MAINKKVAAALKTVAKKKTSKYSQSAPQSKSYKEANDRTVAAKSVGWRWTDMGAARLGKNADKKPSTAEIAEYKNKVFKKGGVEHRYIYSEKRIDKSDVSRKDKFKSGGVSQIAPQSKSYQEANDRLVPAKPVGYRYTTKYANRKDIDPYERPTTEDIEKGKGVYYETRIDKSDRNFRRRFDEGGMDDEYARGGSPKIANNESRSYTENMMPFKGSNLEGKTLDNGDYVVLSYGYYPIWFYSKSQGQWYGNKDKYSQSTGRQISQSRPTYDATILSRRELEEVMFKSSLGRLHDEERIEPNV